MEKNSDSKHPCWSSTPKANCYDLNPPKRINSSQSNFRERVTSGIGLVYTPPKRTQTSEQEYRDMTANNRRPSIPYSRNPSQNYPAVCFLDVIKTCVNIFGILLGFLQNFLESDIWSVVLRHGRTLYWVSCSFGSTASRHLFSRHLV